MAVGSKDLAAEQLRGHDTERLVEERGGGRLSLVVAPDGPIRRMIQLTLLHLSLDVRTADGGR